METGKLTDREQQVHEMIARGLTNRQIAKKLDISPLTAKFHVANLFVKLNVYSRTQAAVMYVLRNCTCNAHIQHEAKQV